MTKLLIFFDVTVSHRNFMQSKRADPKGWIVKDAKYLDVYESA